MNVVFLPGLFGTSLVVDGQQVFPNTQVGIGIQTFLGSLAQLRLNPDGSSMVPVGLGPLFAPYQTFAAAIGAQQIPYDWRRAPQQIAPLMAALIEPQTVIVCHSYGGLVAVALQKFFLSQGMPNQIKAIIFIGSPMNFMYANWTAVQALAGTGTLFQQLANAVFAGRFVNLLVGAAISQVKAALGFASLSQTRQDTIQIASSWWSLGVMASSDPLVRSQNWWSFINPTLTQDWLNTTLGLKASLTNVQLPPYYNLYSQGRPTPGGISNADSFPETSGYIPSFAYFNDGDEAVRFKEQLPNAGGVNPISAGVFTSDHLGQMSDPAVISGVQALLTNISIGNLTPQALVFDNNPIYEIIPSVPSSGYGLRASPDLGDYPIFTAIPKPPPPSPGVIQTLPSGAQIDP